MIKTTIRVVLLAALALTFTLSAAAGEKPPLPAEAGQFDFWVGQWDLEWGEGKKGRNVIEKTFNGHVIIENFDGGESSPLRGMSVSTYNPGLKKWQQTWVDNSGSYLDFTGGWTGSKMVLQRKVEIKGKEILQRMVWYEISKDSLLWNWERSEDGGKTWKLSWKISYTRTKPTAGHK